MNVKLTEIEKWEGFGKEGERVRERVGKHGILFFIFLTDINNIRTLCVGTYQKCSC